MRPHLRCVLLAASISACTPPPEPLHVGFAPFLADGLFFVADARGYLRDAGLAVTPVAFETGAQAVEALFRGEVDAAISSEIPVVRALAEARPLVIVSMISRSRRAVLLVMRGDAGLRAPADLRGRRVGVRRGTNAEFFLSRLLYYHGVSPDAVTLVDLPARDQCDALADGRVDALAAFATQASTCMARLPGRASIHEWPIYYENGLLTKRRDAQHDGAVAHLVAALHRAAADAAARPESVAPILDARLPDTKAAIEDALRTTSLRLGLDNQLAVTLRAELAWIRGDPAARLPEGAFAPAFLLGAAPAAATLLSSEPAP